MVHTINTRAWDGEGICVHLMNETTRKAAQNERQRKFKGLMCKMMHKMLCKMLNKMCLSLKQILCWKPYCSPREVNFKNS